MTRCAPAAWCRPSTFCVMVPSDQAGALELGDGEVARVRDRGAHELPADVAARPVAAPRDRVAGEGLVGHRRVAAQGGARRPAVVRDPGLGRDPRAARAPRRRPAARARRASSREVTVSASTATSSPAGSCAATLQTPMVCQPRGGGPMTTYDGSSGTVSAESLQQWRDRKRYLWLVALVMPMLPFAAVVDERAHRPGVVAVARADRDPRARPARSTCSAASTARTRPTTLIDALENDRYYRWLTFLFLPAAVRRPPRRPRLPDRARDLTTGERIGLAVTIGFIGGLGINTAHELGHKQREPRALAREDRAGAERLRPLLHRAQPRAPRARRDAGRPGQQPDGRELLPVLAAHGRRLGAQRVAAGAAPVRASRQSPWRLGNDVLNAWLMTAVLFAALCVWLGVGVLPYLLLQAVVGFTLLEAVNYLEHYGLLRRRGRARRARALGAGRAPAQLELQQHRHERAALPPAAAQRPPRQPDPALPGAARLRRVARAADRVRRHDPARARAAGCGGA